MAPSLHLILSTASSPMGRVEKATGRALSAPDSMMNMEICGSIISNPWQAKAYVKAVKKRLQNKNSNVQLLALTLLETMMQKCGDVLHFQVVDYEILQEMVRIIRKTRNMQVRDKILALLERWQEAFGGGEGKYPQYYYTYAELKRSGVRFPLSQRGADPIMPNQSKVGRGMPSSSIERFGEIMESGTSQYSMPGLNLDNVRGVAELLNNMLQVVNPKDHQAIKDEVIADLANQCSSNQKKLMKLINSTDNDELLGEAITLNDNLQFALSKYNALVSGSPSSPEKFLAIVDEDDEEDEDEDGFSYIAQRDSVFKSKGALEVSSNKDDMNTSASNALILFDPSSPTSLPKKEEDMIDLLGLTLSENQTSQTVLMPLSSSPPSNYNQNPFLDSPIMSNYPQSLMPNGGYTANENYIAPWAQPALAQLPEPSPFVSQQFSQYPTNYLPRSWTAPRARSNPFQYTSSVQTEYPTSQSNMVFGSTAVTLTGQDHRSFKSLSSRQTLLSTDQKQTKPSSAPKPFMPDNLFDDLIELRNPDGSLKSRNASRLWMFSGQGMTRVN